MKRNLVFQYISDSPFSTKIVSLPSFIVKKSEDGVKGDT